MSSALKTIRELTPRPLKRGARYILRGAAPLWIRGGRLSGEFPIPSRPTIV